ncbi:MAG: sensor histidine kinase, partial [Dehalococcoidia bacterium]
MRILVVDDFLDSLLVTQAALNGMNCSYQVQTADSARDAFRQLGMDDGTEETPEVDLILMDIDMPEIDGVEACRRIKAHPNLQDIPIIMVTSHEEVSYLQAAFDAGAMDYITKPVNRIELGARVRSALTLKGEMDRRKLTCIELERESLAKTQILATVTHELRTPLTSVIGYTNMMLDMQDQVGQLSEKQQEYLEIIQEDSHRLKALIDDLLDIAKIEAGSLKLTPVELDVGKEIESVLQSVQSQFSEKGIHLALDLGAELGPLTTDRLRFTQIMTNLVSNAGKYSPAGTTVTITVTAYNGSVRVEVADQGIGISPADQARLFTKFFRVDNSSTRKVAGTGLGLFITKQLIEAQQGRIWIESEEGKGSVFSFILPGIKAKTRPKT